MSIELLDKTRKINRFLHNNTSSKVVFNDISEVMTECLDSNILILSSKGKVLGSSISGNTPELKSLVDSEIGKHVNPLLNNRLLNVLSTQENVNLETFGFTDDSISDYKGIINPVEISGERLGTVFMYRRGNNYNIDDIILSEYGTTVIGLEIMRAHSEETVEEAHKRQVIESAFSTLSSSEFVAVFNIFDELDGDEGVLVASKIADKSGITRSVIVNALRKLESAGVIESRSSGMKGTYIKILNSHLTEEIEKLRP